MCVVSMIMQHHLDKWTPLTPLIPYTPSSQPLITPAEIEEFRKLLERARQYDREHNQPDCELDEKRRTLRKLAEQLGVEIAFV